MAHDKSRIETRGMQSCADSEIKFSKGEIIPHGSKMDAKYSGEWNADQFYNLSDLESMCKGGLDVGG